MEKYFKICSER